MIRTLPDEIAELLADASPGADAATDKQVAAFFTEHQAASRPDVLNGLRSALVNNIEAGKSRHDSAVSAMAGAMKEARAGYYSAQYADDQLKPIFINAVQVGDNKRTPDRAADEWKSIVAWAVAQASAADLDETRARVEEKMPNNVGDMADPKPEAAQPITLADAHTVFRRWLGSDYDTDTIDAALATVAVERLDGDPLWLLIISGSGNAKTETVLALDGIGAIVTSSLSSEAALLSATPKRERAKAATGGLLRRIGDHGVLVIKDVTSILSMDRNTRSQVLAALREVYDGRWCREVGAEGGRIIDWTGRIAVIGAVTTAWDAAHAVIASMGDRFVLVRADSTTGRQAAGRQAIGNTGDETRMRAELAAAAAGVIAGMSCEPITLTTTETERLCSVLREKRWWPCLPENGNGHRIQHVGRESVDHQYGAMARRGAPGVRCATPRGREYHHRVAVHLMMPNTPFSMPRPPIVDGPVEPASVEFLSPEPPAVVSPAAASIEDAAKAAAKAPVKVRVVNRYRVVWEGKAYIGGETLCVPAETAERWLKFRFVEKVSRGKK
jgi:hypothetical protein